MGRTIIAGVVAALAMFAWAAVAHTVLPFGRTGIQTFPAGAEAGVMDTVKSAVNDASGMYVAPAAAMAGEGTGSGPGLVALYRSNTSYEPSPAMLGCEFAIELVQALILAFLLAQFAPSFVARALGGLLAGVMVGVSTNGSNHIFYGFPLDYTIASAGIQVVQYLLAGIVIGLVLPRAASAAQA
jgi:hypothetical protein